VANCTLLNELLAEQGYAVDCVYGGQAALDWLHDHTPDLVLLDLMMPDISGFDVLAAMRDDTQLGDVPVIVLTAKNLTPQEEAFLNERYADLIRKTQGGPDALLRAIEHARGTPAEPVLSTTTDH
jgi:CheY-like chemotaxis protein